MSLDLTRRPADLQHKQPAQITTTAPDVPRTKSVFAPDSAGVGAGVLLIYLALIAGFGVMFAVAALICPAQTPPRTETTVAAPTTARKPSPRPRTSTETPTERPSLQLVPTVPDDPEVPTSEVSGNPEDAPTETISAGHSVTPPTTRMSGFRVSAARWYQASAAYWTPPKLFTDRPASLQQLADYATHAPWTAQQAGIWRTAGIGYYRLVAYPKTVSKRYGEWVWQRPGRLLLHVGVIKLVTLTGPGSWAVDHLVYPVAHLAGRLFL